MLRPVFLLPLIVLLGFFLGVRCSTWRRNQAEVLREKRVAPSTYSKKWDLDKPIPYIIDSSYSDDDQKIIETVIASIQENTCINFEKDSGPGLKLEFYKDDSVCEAQIGDMREDGENSKVSLASRCIDIRTVEHETIHALGFEHTHQRSDRDSYIRVFDDNIKENKRDQYRKLTEEENSNNYGIPYEYNIIMHYPAKANQHAINTNMPVMLPIDEEYISTFGRSIGILFNDWKMINAHYKCSETCATPITCQNGGYQNPRACEQCVCPQFHNGTNCELERNVVILNPGEPQPINHGWHWDAAQFGPAIGNPDYDQYNKSPVHLIKAPEGSRIRITIDNLNDRELHTPRGCQEQCLYRALEIVDGDLTRAGKRYCCHKNLPKTFVSTSNVIGYRLFAVQGLDFVANVTFTVEGSATSPDAERPLTTSNEPETTPHQVVETVTEPQPPVALGSTTTLAVEPHTEAPVIAPGEPTTTKGTTEDGHSSTASPLVEKDGMLCRCDDSGFKCIVNPNPSSSPPSSKLFWCSCKQVDDNPELEKCKWVQQ